MSESLTKSHDATRSASSTSNPPDVAPAIPSDAATATSTPLTSVAPAIPSDVATATNIPLVAPTTSRVHKAANFKLNDAILIMSDTYLAKEKPRTMQATARAVIKQYDDGDLSAKQLAEFVSSFYEVISDNQDANQEQAAWLSDMERKRTIGRSSDIRSTMNTFQQSTHTERR